MVYSFANAFAFEGQDVPAYGLAIHNRKLFFAPWYTGNVVAIDIDDPTRIQKIYSGVNAKEDFQNDLYFLIGWVNANQSESML